MKNHLFTKVVDNVTGRKKWIVFQLLNSTHREGFLGIAKGNSDLKEFVRKKYPEAVNRWDFERNVIEEVVLERGLTKEQAKVEANHLRCLVHFSDGSSAAE
jgi:hypothetical protein